MIEKSIDENKALVHSFYSRIIGQLDDAHVDLIIAEDYIQHNPMVKTGKSGLLEALAYLKQMPRPDSVVNPIIRTIAEADLVALHLCIPFGPTNKAVIDLFRIEDGVLQEHWDVMEDDEITAPNKTSMTIGTVEKDAAISAKDSRETANRYYKALVAQNIEGASPYLSDALILHIPEVEGNKLSWLTYLDESGVRFNKLHRLIVEHDFVVAQLEAEFEEKSFAVYEILRVAKGGIAELWRVKQEIPALMAHENGMF